jgi:hypothetical protein
VDHRTRSRRGIDPRRGGAPAASVVTKVWGRCWALSPMCRSRGPAQNRHHGPNPCTGGCRVSSYRATLALIACAFAGSLLAGATARADTTGYYVYNLTGNPWVVNYVYTWRGGFEPSPPGPPHPETGQVLMPGADPGHNHIEILQTPPPPPREPIDSAEVRYSLNVQGERECRLGGPPCVLVYLDRFRDNSRCRVYRGPYVCDFDVDRTTVQILEPPGTDYTVPAADKVRQAEVLDNRVCSARNIAARLSGCQFLPEPRMAALGQPHLAGTVEPNCDTVEALCVRHLRRLGSTVEQRWEEVW